MHGFGQHREQVLERVVPRLRTEALGQRHRIFDVGEKNGDLLTLAFDRRAGGKNRLDQVWRGVGAGAPFGKRTTRRGDGRRALGAKARAVWEFSLTRIAAGGEGGRAVHAETGRPERLSPAIRTDHTSTLQNDPDSTLI